MYTYEVPKIFNLFNSVTILTVEYDSILKNCIGMQTIPYSLVPGKCFEITDEQLIWEIKHNKSFYED